MTMASCVVSRLLRTVLVAIVLLPITGCIEIERVISLNPDLSGRASFRMSLNFEPFMKMALEAQRKAQGKVGPIPKEELDAALKEMSDEMMKDPVDKKAMAQSLPAGVTVVDVIQKLDGFKMSVGVTLGFDDVKKLATLKLDDPSKQGVNPSGESLQPFTGLEIVESGGTVRFVMKPIFGGGGKGLMGEPEAAPTGPPNPLTNIIEELPKAFEGMGMGGDMAELKGVIEAMTKDLREVVRFETAWPVLESNATRKDAKGHVWEYTFESIGKLTPKERDAMEIRLVVRKK